ncbi:hypothetical protein CMO83_03965 [Candidatus Woesearchaeota archaeon]|jgi:hypothetical protein|nr:hypothetical protein [Candidatus Woesearchaeota archaeon]MAG91806.1 hypothetical protein [Candidatus Woesearchaeota archaeon]|tara:strand:+ start:6755 stop:7054 length:300 start_codon:yes stop_codon:yes gene_type:complete
MDGLFLDYLIFISQIIILAISVVLGIKIINNKKIKNSWAFSTPILITLIIIFISTLRAYAITDIPNMNIFGGLYFILGLLVFGINAIILGAYLKFVKKA